MVNNVILSAPAIKADRILFGGLLPLEQLFGGRSVLGDAVDVRFDAINLRLEGGDSFVELGDRNWVEVLLAKLGQRVLGLVGKQVVEVHGR
jgi:hypothetical protein